MKLKAGSVESSALARRLVEAFRNPRDRAIERSRSIWLRGGLPALKTAMCENFSLDQDYALKCLFGTCLIAIYLEILPTRRYLFAYAAAVLAPTLL
jgi:hypothetical protein